MFVVKEVFKNSGVVGGVMDVVGGGVKLVGIGIFIVGFIGVKLVGIGVGVVGLGVGLVGFGVVRVGRMMSSGVKRLLSSSRFVILVVILVNGSFLYEVNGI